MFKIKATKGTKAVFLPEGIPPLIDHMTHYRRISYIVFSDNTITAEVIYDDNNKLITVYYKYTGKYWKYINKKS